MTGITTGDYLGVVVRESLRHTRIVYPDAVFHVRSHPSKWADAIAHGRRRGIPDEQLDFEPRTLRDAAREFNVEVY